MFFMKSAPFRLGIIAVKEAADNRVDIFKLLSFLSQTKSDSITAK